MEIRHLPQAPTGLRPLAAGAGIGAHRHDTHQIVYARHGVLSVTTDAGTWVAPANRAIWIPAGTVHEHRAHGTTEIRLVGLTANPLGLTRPAVLSVDPLLRELIIAYTDQESPEAEQPAGDAATGGGTSGIQPPEEQPTGAATGRGTSGEQEAAPGTASPPAGTQPAARDEPHVGALARDRPSDHPDPSGSGAELGSGRSAAGPQGVRQDPSGSGAEPNGGPLATGKGHLEGDHRWMDGGERERLLAVLLDRVRRAREQPLHLPAPRDPRLAAVWAALRADPADSRTLARHAADAGTSERTLARLCRKELGMTFPQWRTQLRLHHTLLLLAEGVSVTQVAHRCGWSSASAFIDAFRRALGYTPGRAFTL